MAPAALALLAAGAQQHRLLATGAQVLRDDRLLAGLLALARLEILAPLLEPRAADELAPRLLAVVAHQRLAALGAHLAGFLAALGRHLLLGRRQRLGERPPELVQHIARLPLVALDVVEFLLHVRRELQVHDLREMLDEQIRHRLADVRGVEAPLAHLHIGAVGRRDLADDRRIGTRPADALLLERLDQ